MSRSSPLFLKVITWTGLCLSSIRLSLWFQSCHHLTAARSLPGSGLHFQISPDSPAEETPSARNFPAHSSMCCSRSKRVGEAQDPCARLPWVVVSQGLEPGIPLHASQCGTLPLGRRAGFPESQAYAPSGPGLPLPPVRDKAWEPKKPKGQEVKSPRAQEPREWASACLLFKSLLPESHVPRSPVGVSSLPTSEGQFGPCLLLPLFWPSPSVRGQSLQSLMLCISSFLWSHQLPSCLWQFPSSWGPSLPREGKVLLIFSSTWGFLPAHCLLQGFGLTRYISLVSLDLCGSNFLLFKCITRGLWVLTIFLVTWA